MIGFKSGGTCRSDRASKVRAGVFGQLMKEGLVEYDEKKEYNGSGKPWAEPRAKHH